MKTDKKNAEKECATCAALMYKNKKFSSYFSDRIGYEANCYICKNKSMWRPLHEDRQDRLF